jgi:2,4-dienoyl-CoA reductase-like NADH-dependent reductase (Old Yellow Enzyme family)
MIADLFAPVALGSVRLRNRVVMAPVARGYTDYPRLEAPLRQLATS